MTEKAIIYRRFSTDEQEKGDSLARQLRACEAFATSRGWEVISRPTDKGLSAYKGDHLARGELGKLTRQVQNDEVEPGTIIVAEKLDRLSRRPIAEAMNWIHGLTSRGVKIALVDSGDVFDDKADVGAFLAMVMRAAQNHEEPTKISERVLAAKRSRWRDAESRVGKWVNLAGRPPLWLKRNATLDGWIIDEYRAQVIKDIYQWSADGLGSTAMCRRLNESGVKPWGVWRKYESVWCITSVHAILRNPAVEGDFVGLKGMFAGKTIKGFYPVIVDADLVSRARAGKAERRKMSGVASSNGISNIFSGLTVCGECGSRAFMTSSKTKGKIYQYIRCEGARQNSGCSNTGYYSYGKFEESALETIADLALDDTFFESSTELRELRIRKAENEKSILTKTKARARLIEAFGGDDDEQVATHIVELKTQLQELKAELSEIEHNIEIASGKVGDADHLRRVNDIREAAKADDSDIREQARSKLRKAIAAITSSVEIEHDHEGEKVFTLILSAGVMAIRFRSDGTIKKAVSDAIGKPLYDFLSPERRRQVEPLIRRIERTPAA